MPKTLTFAGRPEDTLEYEDPVGSGKTHVVHGGEAFKVSDDVALELITNPHIPIGEEGEDYNKLSRAELDQIASDAGIDPGEHRNKADLIEAIQNAPEPQADHPLPPVVEESSDQKGEQT